MPKFRVTWNSGDEEIEADDTADAEEQARDCVIFEVEELEDEDEDEEDDEEEEDDED